METRTIFFIGKPGCGKGTQAELLSERTGWRVITAGDQFREIAAEDTPVGRKVKIDNDTGLLQPHWLAEYLFLRSLFSVEEENIIFDGFGRKVSEAQIVIDSLKWLGRPFTILEIQVADESVRGRLSIRKDIEGRADDSVVDKRLKEYHEYTDTAIELFRKAGVLIEINGEPSPEEIAEDIRKKLGLA